MQNKGFVRVLAVALILVCSFYLSFSFVTNHYSTKAEEYAQGNSGKYYNYLDSISTEKVWLGYTLKECREKEINLGLDLKGGMNVILEISVPDIVKTLANNNTSPNFQKAITVALAKQANSQSDFLTLFEQSFMEIDPNVRLSTIFSTFELKDKISLSSSNAEVMKVLREEVDAAVSNSFNILRTRIDRFGVVQPNIQRLENSGRILVELPGIKEPARVRKLLQGTANLEFWETYEVSEIAQSFMTANDVLKSMEAGNAVDTAKVDTTKAVAAKSTKQSAMDSLAAAMSGAKKAGDDAKVDKAQVAKENPLLGLLRVNIMQNGQAAPGANVGVAHYSDTAKINQMLSSARVKELFPRDLSLKWGVKAIDDKEQYFELYAIKVTNRDGKAPLEGDVITDANSDFGQHSSYANVSMQMNPDGASIWARLTEQNIGRCIAIVLDGYVYSAPRVNDKIAGGRSEISGNFTVEEAKDLANVLKSGKMPAPARIVQEDVVGPSLGQEAIENGFASFAIAFALVLIYMIFFYGTVPGLVADAALLLNVFLLLGILASFKAVLTLPGIAGIVLTLGMAVDTNVLIYERIREELRAGKGLVKSVQEGYQHASSAIVDANLTTIITGVVLFVFGTGPIKGFATTLIIGIITSLITGFVLSRIAFEAIVLKDKYKNLSFTTNITKNWFHNTKIRFIENRKIGYTISAVLILASCVSFAVRGLNQGIDFSGGRNYVIRFDAPVNTESVKTMLRGAFDGQTPGVIAVKSNDAANSDNRVRISTNYKIEDGSPSVDSEIEGRLYKGLKPLLAEGVTQADFVSAQILSSQKVGPTVADDIKVSAIWAVVLAILAIGLYILIRFKNVAFSVGGIASLSHDALIVLGLYSLLYSIMPFSLEIDQAFIAAILTVIGYSINDTVIIFDRVREYRALYPNRDIKTTIDDGLNSTLARTFNTTFTTAIVLVAIFIFGGESIRGFIFALLIGIVVGTYSSLFVAVPLAHDILDRKIKKSVKK